MLAADEQDLLEMVLTHKRRLLSEWNSKVCVAHAKEDIKHERKKKSGGAHGG